MKYLWVIALSIGFLFVASCGHVYADDYGKGWCDAWKLAVEVSHRNRDHWRALVDLPPKASNDVLKNAYEKWPPSDCENEATTVKKTLCLAGVSLDLYVVLSAIPPEANVLLPNGDIMHCPAGEREPSATSKEQ